LRSEVGWVTFSCIADLILTFISLKACTMLLSKSAFGEYNLGMTAMVLLAYVFLFPMNQAYLRYFHTAEANGTARSAGLAVLTWYGVTTTMVAVILMVATAPLSKTFGLELFVPLAVGLAFLASYWRWLGVEVLRIQRSRKMYSLQSVSFQVLRAVFLVAAIYWVQASATWALLAHAAAAMLLAVFGIVPLARRILSKPRGPRGDLMKMVWTFGIPSATVFVCLWIQAFADRYIVAYLLDFESVAVYVAAYQVCGVPYTMLATIMDNLVVPIAYQRTKDIKDARQVWAGGKAILIGAVAYVVIGAFGLLLYVVLGQQLLVLLTTNKYLVSINVILVMTGCRYVQSLATMLDRLFAVHHRMTRSFVFRAVGGGISLALCWFGTKWFGFLGAVTGVFLGSLAYLVLAGVGPGGWVWLVWRNRKKLMDESFACDSAESFPVTAVPNSSPSDEPPEVS